MDGTAVAASFRRWRAADVGDFRERGFAVGEIAEQLESLLESRLPTEPRWLDAGAVTDGFVISFLSETPPHVAFQGELWLLGGNHSWGLPVMGSFTLTAEEASVAAVELMLGDAAVGLEPVAHEPRQGSNRDWMFRFTWP